MNRSTLVHIHLFFAAVLLPFILMLGITGGLYVWGVKGSVEETRYIIPISQPLKQDSKYLHEWLEDVLEIRGIDEPSGRGKLITEGLSYYYQWTGSSRSVIVAPTEDIDYGELVIQENGFYRYLVQLQQGKGGLIFNVYIALVALGLLFLSLSGLVMALRMVRFKMLTQRYLILGSMMFVISVLAS